MATIISSKTTGGGGLAVTGDSSGVLQLASGDGTTAVTIDASQNVFVGGTTQNTATAPVYSSTTCKAWVNYKGTVTRAINASFNVSSVTFNATGDYTINFTSAMVDANYCVSGIVQGITGVNGAFVQLYDTSSPTATTSVRVQVKLPTSANTDTPIMCLNIFR